MKTVLSANQTTSHLRKLTSADVNMHLNTCRSPIPVSMTPKTLYKMVILSCSGRRYLIITIRNTFRIVLISHIEKWSYGTSGASTRFVWNTLSEFQEALRPTVVFIGRLMPKHHFLFRSTV